MLTSRLVARIVLAAAVVATSATIAPPPPAFAGNSYILLTPHSTPGWPVRSDGNWGRTTNFGTLSVDGHFGLISAGAPSGGGGGWTSIYISDNVAGTLTL